jgi:hypothetical protein
MNVSSKVGTLLEVLGLTLSRTWKSMIEHIINLYKLSVWQYAPVMEYLLNIKLTMP